MFAFIKRLFLSLGFALIIALSGLLIFVISPIVFVFGLIFGISTNYKSTVDKLDRKLLKKELSINN
jgi:hypothetical protein